MVVGDGDDRFLQGPRRHEDVGVSTNMKMFAAVLCMIPAGDRRSVGATETSHVRYRLMYVPGDVKPVQVGSR